MIVFEINQYSLIGAFAGLLIGLIDVAFASRFIYPSARMRHETAKMNGRRSMAPSTLMGLFQVFGYIVLPIAGYVVANIIFNQSAQVS
jgi:hypothetical protein